MTGIWDEKPEFPIGFTTDYEHYKGLIKWWQKHNDAWLEKVREELREARSQSRVNGQHRMLYQGQRDELRKKIEAINTHVTKWVSGHSDWQMGHMNQWKKKLVQILGETQTKR